MIVSYSSCFVFEKYRTVKILILFICTGTRIRTQIKGFGDLYSTIELCPYCEKMVYPFSKKVPGWESRYFSFMLY